MAFSVCRSLGKELLVNIKIHSFYPWSDYVRLLWSDDIPLIKVIQKPILEELILGSGVGSYALRDDN